MSNIPLHQMAQVANIQEPWENWTGLMSATGRRRLQNRLNQREHRKTKRIQDIETGVVRRPRGRPKKSDAPELRSDNSDKIRVIGNKESVIQQKYGNPDETTSPTVVSFFRPTQAALTATLFTPSETKRRYPRSGRKYYVCEMNQSDTLKLVDHLANEAYQATQLGCARALPADMFLSLTQFNVMRAIFMNMAALNLTMDDIKEDTVSRFNRADYNDQVDLYLLPPSLRPTTFQKSIIHHPWIDPLPLPSFRDALLLADGLYSDVELCHDLIAQCGPENMEQVGIIIWGDPWDIYGSEMTESFASKWLWLFSGCRELLESTNYWRTQRGEQRLFSIQDLAVVMMAGPGEIIPVVS